MKTNPLDLSKLTRGFKYFFNRFHFIVFFILAALTIGPVTYFLSQTLLAANTVGTATTSVDSASFDKDTINNLKKLDLTIKESQPLTLPSGRINPFTE